MGDQLLYIQQTPLHVAGESKGTTKVHTTWHQRRHISCQNDIENSGKPPYGSASRFTPKAFPMNECKYKAAKVWIQSISSPCSTKPSGTTAVNCCFYTYS